MGTPPVPRALRTRRSRSVVSIVIVACWGILGEAPPVRAEAASIQVNGQWANAGAGVRTGVLGSFATYTIPRMA